MRPTIALASISACTLLAAPILAQGKPGDLLVASLQNPNELELYRPDGTSVGSTSGSSSDWWIGAALTPELAWVTTNMTPTGWELLRFDALGNPFWDAPLPQVWLVDGIAVDGAGTLLVADPVLGAVHCYDLWGNPLALWTLTIKPNRLEVGPDDDVWVGDLTNQQVEHLDATGATLGSFALPFLARAMTLAPDGTLWFSDQSAAKLWHVDAAGTLLGSLDLPGSWNTQYDVAAAHDGTLWILGHPGLLRNLDVAGNVLGSFPVEPASTVVRVVAPGGPLGQSFCGPALANSTGSPGVISASGRAQVALNELRLHATQLPPGRFGIFLASQTLASSNPPGSQGTLCLGGSLGIFKLQVASTGAAGELEIEVDLSSIPTVPPTAVQPGETWSFQAWFRDVNPGSTSGFTDGVAIGFQ